MAQKKVIPISRRELLKTGVAATAAMSVGLPVTQACAQAAQAADAGIEWHKGVCRFCGNRYRYSRAELEKLPFSKA